MAGQKAVRLDDEGDRRRCFFVGAVIGNLFRDGWATCPCYGGHMHVVVLGCRAVYGDYLAVRIPLAYHPGQK